MNTTLDFWISEEAKEIPELHSISAEETINFLNRCAGFSLNTLEERARFDTLDKIARGRGKSLQELKQELEINKEKAKEAIRLQREFENNPQELSKSTRSLRLMAEVIASNWDFYSDDVRDFWKKYAFRVKDFIERTNIKKYIDAENIVQEHLTSCQILVNSILGSLETLHLETDLARKLFSIRQKIIFSGEKLMTLENFDSYLESDEDEESAVRELK